MFMIITAILFKVFSVISRVLVLVKTELIYF